MKIGLVSDTHMLRSAKALPTALRQGLVAHRVELILHMGDFTSLVVAELLAEIAPFDAVAGNNDADEIRRRYGRRKILSVEGLRIGMIHGDGARKSTLQRALDAFADDVVDMILFGHSHSPYCQRHGNAWVVNPGSPTDKRHSPLYSYGVVEIHDGRATPAIHTYSDKTVRP